MENLEKTGRCVSRASAIIFEKYAARLCMSCEMERSDIE